MPKVSTEQKRKARIVNLYDWAMVHALDLFDKEGASLRLKSNHSVSIKKEYCGYKDFGADESEGRLAKGNAIDFLMIYCNMTFVEAVRALVGDDGTETVLHDQASNPAPEQRFFLPPKAANQRRLFGYLCKTRCIPAPTVEALYKKGLIYQSEGNGNIIFHTPGETWAEVRGTLTDKTYHGIVAGSSSTGCWCFRVGNEAPEAAYITEAAIDAISLACVLGTPAWYISIGGAGKQTTIDRVKAGKLPVVIATDADRAGDEAAERNKELQRVRPENGCKDWNEVLQNSLTLYNIAIV